MFRLNSNDHGLVDPTRIVTISLWAASALLFVLFFDLTGYNYRAGTQHEVFFLPIHLSDREHAALYLAAAVLAVSLGLIASVVRYRYPIASTFAVVTIAPILGVMLLFFIGVAFAAGLGEELQQAFLVCS